MPSMTTGLSAIGFVIVPLSILSILGLWILSNWISRISAGESTDAVERKRIMEMVGSGKLSPEEGKELLDALGRSSAMRGEEKFSRLDIIILIGVSLVILGFFLPWAYIRLPDVPGLFGQRGSAYQAGYHAGALGWAVFIIAIISTVPVFVTPKNFLYKISMLQIFLTIIGAVLVISILVRVGDRLGVGLIFCLAGFVVELIAARAKFKRLAA